MNTGNEKTVRREPGRTETDEIFDPVVHFADEEPVRPRGPLEKMPSLRSARPAALFLILFYAASTLHGSHPVGNALWASGEQVYRHREYWRLATALFVHADLLHLLSNAFMFMVFGWLLRAYFGLIMFPVTVLAAGIVTNGIVCMIYDPGVRLVGASGMVYAMAALWLVLYIRFDVGRSIAQRLLRTIGFVMVMLVPSTLDPGVSYLSHGVGFCTGCVLGLVGMFVISPVETG